MIQKYYLFLIITQVLATAFLQPAKAGSRTPAYIATATDRSVRLSKGQVEVSFMLDLGERIVYANHQRRVTPVLVSADGTRQAELPAVVANGRNRAIKLQKEPQNNDKEAYVTLRGNKEENRHVSYRAAIAYEPWMDNARLSLREEVTGCNCGDVLQAEQTLKEQALYQPLLQPSAEAECPRIFTPRSRQCDAFLIYPVDQTRLYPNRYGNAAELASLLKTDKDTAAEMKSNFSFQVNEITRFVPGELNQEIFDQVFGKDVVKTEEEFRAKVKDAIAHQFTADSDYKFLIDVRKHLMEKVGKLEFADALLKRIMLQNNKDKGEKFVDDNYDKSIEELTWHLIKEQLVKANGIKVEQEDIVNMAKEATRAQFAQYGMLNVPEELLDNYSKEMLKKQENVEGLVNRVIENKLANVLKGQVTLEHKPISAADFNKMFE